MSSQSRATRENQKKLYDERLQARQAVLEKRGMTPKEFKKDKVYEHLKAQHQAIVKAIAVIDASLARKDRPAPEAKDAKKAAPAPTASEKKPKKEKPEKAAKAAPAKTDE